MIGGNCNELKTSLQRTWKSCRTSYCRRRCRFSIMLRCAVLICSPISYQEGITITSAVTYLWRSLVHFLQCAFCQKFTTEVREFIREKSLGICFALEMATVVFVTCVVWLINDLRWIGIFCSAKGMRPYEELGMNTMKVLLKFSPNSTPSFMAIQHWWYLKAVGQLVRDSVAICCTCVSWPWISQLFDGSARLVVSFICVADMLQVCALHKLRLGNSRPWQRLRLDIRLLFVHTLWPSDGPRLPTSLRFYEHLCAVMASLRFEV